MHRSCDPTLSPECYLVAIHPVLAGQGMFREGCNRSVPSVQSRCDRAADTLATGLLTLWRERQAVSPPSVQREETLSALGEISALDAHGPARRRHACSHASSGHVTCRSHRAAAGKAAQAPTNSQSGPLASTSALKPQWRMTPTLRSPWMTQPADSSDPDFENGHEMTGSERMMSDTNRMRRRTRCHGTTDRTEPPPTRKHAEVRPQARLAHQPCQITHARATSCLVSTRRQVRW
jgi:hypothetical protein